MGKFLNPAILSILAAGILARVLLFVVPFSFLPDTYYYNSQAVQALLSGADPYGHHYLVPAVLGTPGAENVFAYLPGVFLFLAPFGLLGDVRIGLVFCDVLIALALNALGGRRASMVAGTYFLLPFTVLLSTWFPNSTLVAMALVALAVALDRKGMRTLSAVFLGLALGSSQFVWLIYPFFLLVHLHSKEYSRIAVEAAAAAALVVPFLAWNPGAFVNDTVYFEYGRPVLGLVTITATGLNLNPSLSGFTTTLVGYWVPFVIKAGLTLAALVTLLYRTRDNSGKFFSAASFLLLADFVLPNDFYWLYLEFPFQLFLVWFLYVHGGPAGAGIPTARHPADGVPSRQPPNP